MTGIREQAKDCSFRPIKKYTHHHFSNKHTLTRSGKPPTHDTHHYIGDKIFLLFFIFGPLTTPAKVVGKKVQMSFIRISSSHRQGRRCLTGLYRPPGRNKKQTRVSVLKAQKWTITTDCCDLPLRSTTKPEQIARISEKCRILSVLLSSQR